MTPKQKANNLVDNFKSKLIQIDSDISEEIVLTGAAKECALICVTEILKTQNLSLGDMSDEQIPPEHYREYWIKVKKEIQSL